MKKYISYLLHTALHKVSLWVVAIIYALIIGAFCILVPIMANIAALNIWVQNSKMVQMTCILIISVFSAMIAVFIFREPQEDGTELLICSKPIERKKLILAKFITYAIFLAFYSILPTLVLIIALFIPSFNLRTTALLLGSIICGNIVSMFLFGAIAALLSLRLNKVLVIVTNMSIVVLLSIYNTVIMATPSDPLKKMIRDKKYATSNTTYIGKDNKGYGSSVFLPVSQNIEEFLKILSLEGQKEIWNNATKHSPYKIINAFNVVNQLSTIFWSGEINQAWLNQYGTSGIGDTVELDYNIDRLINSEAQDFVDQSQWEPTTNFEAKPLLINDDDPSWTDFNKKDVPFAYINTHNVQRSTTRDLAIQNSKTPEIPQTDDPEEFIKELIENWSSWLSDITPLLIDAYTNTSVHFFENASDFQLGNSKYFDDAYRTKNVDTWIAARFYDGLHIHKNRRNINWQKLVPNEYEEDMFNAILFNVLFNNEENADIFNQNIIDSTWSIQLNWHKQGALICLNIYQYIYDCFIKNHLDLLNIKNDHDLGIFFTKFKLYVWQKLLGQYGTDDYILKHTYDYKEGKKLDKGIIIPWQRYFRCVFNTQFNSLNTANKSEFNDLAKIALNHGFLPINNWYVDQAGRDDDYNTLNVFALNWIKIMEAQGEPEINVDIAQQNIGINRLKPLYNGNTFSNLNQDINELIDPTIFEAYDTAASEGATEWNNWPKLGTSESPIYGYISKLGLEAQALLNEFATGEYAPIYNGEQYIEQYTSKMWWNAQNLLVYENLIFRYSVKQRVHPGVYAAIYLALSLILLWIGYARYIKYDFK